MRNTRKITYTAAATALAAVCILASRFLPVKIMPLAVASFCFYLAFRVGVVNGFLCIAASLLLTFFWGNLDISMLLTGFYFAPYAVLAFVLKKYKYTDFRGVAFRASGVIVLFNAMLALIVFVFFSLTGDLFLGFDITKIGESVGSNVLAYMLVSVVGSLLAIGLDVMFLMADELITKKLNFDNK